MSDWPEADLNSKRSYDVAIEAMRERLEKFRCERIGSHQLFLGDCAEVVPLIGQVHSVVTDPPYALTSIVKRFGTSDAKPAAYGKDGLYQRASRGFMGSNWDNGSVAFSPEFWAKACGAIKPGGFVAAFGGDRTFHRLYCAIEDGGFEPRHTAAWLYGSGFPKNLNVTKKIEEMQGWCECDA